MSMYVASKQIDNSDHLGVKLHFIIHLEQSISGLPLAGVTRDGHPCQMGWTSNDISYVWVNL